LGHPTPPPPPPPPPPESPNHRNNVSRAARNKIEKRAFLPIMGKNTLLCWWNIGHLLGEKTGIRKKYGHSYTRRLFSDKLGMPSAGQDGRPSAYLLLGAGGQTHWVQPRRLEPLWHQSPRFPFSQNLRSRRSEVVFKAYSGFLNMPSVPKKEGQNHPFWGPKSGYQPTDPHIRAQFLTNQPSLSDPPSRAGSKRLGRERGAIHGMAPTIIGPGQLGP